MCFLLPGDRREKAPAVKSRGRGESGGRDRSCRRPTAREACQADRMAAPIRIANCSGFFGDRLSAAREMVEGGPIDVLTGDYLAELTMAILWRSRSKGAGSGFASTFLLQMKQVLGTCLDREKIGRAHV